MLLCWEPYTKFFPTPWEQQQSSLQWDDLQNWLETIWVTDGEPVIALGVSLAPAYTRLQQRQGIHCSSLPPTWQTSLPALTLACSELFLLLKTARHGWNCCQLFSRAFQHPLDVHGISSAHCPYSLAREGKGQQEVGQGREQEGAFCMASNISFLCSLSVRNTLSVQTL